MITKFKLYEISNSDFLLSDTEIKKLKNTIFQFIDDENEVKDYIRYGGNVNKINRNNLTLGTTLLMSASELQQMNVVKLLIAPR